jgi:hypothetical protein
MFKHTDTKASPWWVVPSDDKKAAHVSLSIGCPSACLMRVCVCVCVCVFVQTELCLGLYVHAR